MAGLAGLIPLTERLIDDVGSQVDDPYFWMQFLKSPATAKPDSLADTWRYIQSEPLLEWFRSGWFQLAGVGMAVQPHQLIVFLAKRGSDVGASGAVAELERYLTETELPLTYRLFVAGVGVAAPIEFEDGLRIVPYQPSDDTDPYARKFFGSLEYQQTETPARCRGSRRVH